MEKHLLRRTKVAVLAIIVLGFLAGRSDFLWPAMTWTMYSTMPEARLDRFQVGARATSDEPREQARRPVNASAVELRAVSEEGRLHTVALSNREPVGAGSQSRPLFEIGRRTLAEEAVEQAFAPRATEHRNARRAYLARQVASALPEVEIARIEGWRRVWEVDPLAVPPLDRGSPHKIVLLGSFEPADYQGGAR